MSTVLWANHLINGEVKSDQSDKWALYKFAQALDKLAAAHGDQFFTSLFDYTDLQVTLGDRDMPDGMESTDELMAREGVWKSADDALSILDGLLAAMTAATRPALAGDDHDAVVAELAESIEYAKRARAAGAKFNFSVVM